MKISIVIPIYNNAEILKKNLPSVIDSVKSFERDTQIVLSDDFSKDESVNIANEFIEKNKDIEIILLTSNKNGGFSSNVNKGVRQAKGDIVVLLNSDVSPKENFLKSLLDHFKDEKIFAVGCLDESVENGKIVLRGRGKGVWKKGFLAHSAADTDSDKKETLWVSGGSGAFRKTIWNKLGGLDEVYNPFYWEDIDLSYRALKSGYKIIFEKESIVKHEHEEGVIKKKFTHKKVNEIVYRNQFIFAWKNSDLNNFLIGLVWLPIHLINAIRGNEMGLIKGFFLALGKLPHVLKFRLSKSKNFIFSDKQITDSVI